MSRPSLTARSHGIFNFKVFPRLFTRSSQNMDPEQPPPPTTRQQHKKPSMWRLMWRELMRKHRFESNELERLYQRYVLQANLNHLANLLGLLIATSMVMEVGLVSIAIRTSTVPGDTGGSSINHVDQNLTLGAVVLGIVAYAGCMFVIFRWTVNETFLTKISYVLIAVFIVQEIALSRIQKHLWSTIFFIYITYALLPVRLLDAVVSGIAISFAHLPFLYYSRTHYYEQHWKTFFEKAAIMKWRKKSKRN